LLHQGLYKQVKQQIWLSIGKKLYLKRDVFLAHLLEVARQELQTSKSVSSSEPCLLDIGCGTGNLTEKIAEMYNLNAVGIDYSKHFSSKGKALFLTADSCKLPFKSQSFVFCSAFSLIEHIPKECRQEFFKQVRETLKTDGFFIVQLPNRYFPIEHHSFLPLVGYLPSRLHSLFYYEYVRVPSRKETIHELANNGFTVIKNVGYGIPAGDQSRFISAIGNLFSKVIPFGFIIVAKNSAINIQGI
jgi:SAM-dependent methyltransferase